jgi:transposase
MALAIGVILAAVAVTVVLWPFFRGRRAVAPPGHGVLLAELGRRRQAIYVEIQSLQSEYELGEVEPQEHQRRLGVLRLQAAEALRDQERVEERLAALDEALEQEIRTVRASRDGAGEAGEGPGGGSR